MGFEDFELVSSYTRAEALADGTLVDVTETAREAGIRCPVAVTQAVWAEYVALSDAAWRAGNDERGRLWDIVSVFRSQVVHCNGSECRFDLYVVTESVRPSLVSLKAMIGPGDEGEPVITILKPEED